MGGRDLQVSVLLTVQGNFVPDLSLRTQSQESPSLHSRRPIPFCSIRTYTGSIFDWHRTGVSLETSYLKWSLNRDGTLFPTENRRELVTDIRPLHMISYITEDESVPTETSFPLRYSIVTCKNLRSHKHVVGPFPPDLPRGSRRCCLLVFIQQIFLLRGRSLRPFIISS